MSKIVNWIKNNKLTSILLLLVGYLLLHTSIRLPRTLQSTSLSLSPASREEVGESFAELDATAQKSIIPPIPEPEAPPTETQDRLVIQDTSLSLLVKDVGQTIKDIETKAEELDGFLVNSHLNVPEGASTGNITVRVPEDNRQQALAAFKDLAVKTVSETVSGKDVTDQYVDLEARIEVLTKTKSKFEAILNTATQVQDILQVQRELTSLQTQIDSLKGQQKYLEQSAKLSKITVYLSTDELALPFTPDQPWRPKVIFKTAVRSLIKSLRSVGTLTIWALVFSPILLLILVAFWLFKRFSKRLSKRK